MTLTTSQQSVYNIMLSMNNNGQLTDNNRSLLLSVDLTNCGITQDDKKAAIRAYEHIVGCTFNIAA